MPSRLLAPRATLQVSRTGNVARQRADVLGQEAPIDADALDLPVGQNDHDLGVRALADDPSNDEPEQAPEDAESLFLRLHVRRVMSHTAVPPSTAPATSPMPTGTQKPSRASAMRRSEERRVGKECRSRWS